MLTRQKLRGLMAVTSRADLVTLTEFLESGRLRPPLERTFPLEQAPDAIRYLHEGLVRGKVAVTL